jgi:hypothetical protein
MLSISKSSALEAIRHFTHPTGIQLKNLTKAMSGNGLAIYRLNLNRWKMPAGTRLT